MKRRIVNYLFITAMLPLAAMSCASDGAADNPVGIVEDENSTVDDTSWASAEEVAAFFESETAISEESHGRPIGFFLEPTEEELTRDDGTFVRVVNSMEELAALYEGEKQLPAIDFSSQTLLIGMVSTSADDEPGGRQQSLTEQATRYDLNLSFVKYTDMSHFDMMIPFCYWGIYSKLGSKPVEVHVSYVDKKKTSEP